jgi:hypothetical protein
MILESDSANMTSVFSWSLQMVSYQPRYGSTACRDLNDDVHI